MDFQRINAPNFLFPSSKNHACVSVPDALGCFDGNE